MCLIYERNSHSACFQSVEKYGKGKKCPEIENLRLCLDECTFFPPKFEPVLLWGSTSLWELWEKKFNLPVNISQVFANLNHIFDGLASFGYTPYCSDFLLHFLCMLSRDVMIWSHMIGKKCP